MENVTKVRLLESSGRLVCCSHVEISALGYAGKLVRWSDRPSTSRSSSGCGLHGSEQNRKRLISYEMIRVKNKTAASMTLKASN